MDGWYPHRALLFKDSWPGEEGMPLGIKENQFVNIGQNPFRVEREKAGMFSGH